MKISLIILFSLLLPSYDIGDEISLEDQGIEADICWGYHPINFESEIFTLGDLNGELNGGHYSVTMLSIQASWWSPSYQSVWETDPIYQEWEGNSHVTVLTLLDDINQPYSCEQWGNLGTSSNDLIIDDGISDYDFFNILNHDNCLPTYVFIDHNMVVHYKSNSISTGQGIIKIEEMLSICGELCQQLQGDINFDNILNIQDLIIILNMILASEYHIYLDMNNDDILNIQDIITILNIILSD